MDRRAIAEQMQMAAQQTEQLGIAALKYFFSEHGWLFREQPTQDYGIDAHIEIVLNERPTGKLIALQIKSGKSFFESTTPTSYIFRTDDKHISYWVDHSMPVILVLFNPETKSAHWQHVSRENCASTGKGWKIDVPLANMFSEPARTLESLEELTQPEPYIRRLNRLRVDRRWIELILSGEEVRISFESWVNKSLPRYQITIYTHNDAETWPILYAPGLSVESMLDHFFPWASFAVDEELHALNAEGDWAAECYCGHDQETGENYYSKPFRDWYSAPTTIMPVSNNGETAQYVLILTLSDFGRSFVCIDDYLSDPDAQENIGFTLE